MNPEAKPFKRYTVTSALPYANGPLHIGHMAGAYLPADIYARYLRSQGRDVVYVCGTDEHGAAINMRARKDGTTPQEVVDKYHEIIREAFEKLNFSFDVFSRTSKPIHHETAQEFFLHFYENGLLEEKTTEQLYDEAAQMFLADRFVKGTCPKCGYEEAYGDQCERCGSTLSPTDLINPVSTISGAKPVLKTTKHWYLPLQDYQERLEQYVLKDHTEWKSNVYGQCKSWLDDGLQPRAISRDLDWGVKIPLEQADGKVLYVWFDAPIGYISATKEWAEREGTDWKKWWQDKDTALVHFIGKDNIVFHCLIFPAILMGKGEYILPENVPGNEFMNLEGEKMSTSRNHAVWLHELVEDFPDQIDVIRYALTAMMPETKDSNFTWKEFQTRNNSELADILGNFVNRITVLTDKYFDGQIQPMLTMLEMDHALVAEVEQHAAATAASIEQFRFREALQNMMNIARAGNKYLADTEPWKLYKTDPARVGTILFFSTYVMAATAIAAAPFMPGTSEKLFEMLGIEPQGWDKISFNEMAPLLTGKLTKGPVLFPQVTDEQVEVQEQKLATAKQSNPQAKPAAEETSFDEFQKMDIRVVTIKKAGKVEKADKLLQLEVDTGFDIRTIVSGVAEHFKPEELEGRQALALVNLPPRKIRGVVSNGMLLFAEDAEGKLQLVGPAQAMENGAKVS